MAPPVDRACSLYPSSIKANDVYGPRGLWCFHVRNTSGAAQRKNFDTFLRASFGSCACGHVVPFRTHPMTSDTRSVRPRCPSLSISHQIGTVCGRPVSPLGVSKWRSPLARLRTQSATSLACSPTPPVGRARYPLSCVVAGLDVSDGSSSAHYRQDDDGSPTDDACNGFVERGADLPEITRTSETRRNRPATGEAGFPGVLRRRGTPTGTRAVKMR